MCAHLSSHHGYHDAFSPISYCHGRSLLSTQTTHSLSVLPSHPCLRGYATKKQDKPGYGDTKNTDQAASGQEPSESSDSKYEDISDQNLTVFQRFKKTYKEHGKVLVCVHIATSVVWFGSFYMIASRLVPVVKQITTFVEKEGMSEPVV